MHLERYRRPAAVIVALIVMAAIMVACGDGDTDTTQLASTTSEAAGTTIPVATTAPVTTTVPVTATIPVTTTLPTTTTTAVSVSPESIAYAEELGGTSHEGEPLYLVIGASVETEREAQLLLEEALPFFGDMQSYFIVQWSDNFEGLAPGWWVIIEAYYAEPDGSQIDFCRRGFPDACFQEVTVLTSDPIPVYEDMIGSPTLEVMHDAIAESGSVAVDFEITDYLIRGDWAGVIISAPGHESASVLLFHSGLVGWAVVDLGTDLPQQDLLDAGAPPEIAGFLSSGG